MKTSFQNIFLLLMPLLLSLNACIDTVEFPPTPEIQFLSQTSTNVNEFDATEKITISFTDGDGDLGWGDDAVLLCDNDFICNFTSDSSCYTQTMWSIILIDMRDSCYVIPYNIPDLEPNGDIKAIQGELDIQIPALICKNFACPTCPTDDVVYQVVIKDRAQNFSNVIFSQTITINCN